MKTERPRGRPKQGHTEISDEQAKQYGITVPVLSPDTDQFLSPNDIGKILNVTGEAVKQWIYRRKLPAVKLANGYWKVKKTDFEGFLKSRTEIGKRHVLVAPGVQKTAIVQSALSDLGLEPIFAHNYADALLKALDHFPTLFIIPVGADTSKEDWLFAKRIRGNKSLRSFPILFLANVAMDDKMLEAAVALYAQGTLDSSSLDAKQLSGEIDRILRRSM